MIDFIFHNRRYRACPIPTIMKYENKDHQTLLLFARIVLHLKNQIV